MSAPFFITESETEALLAPETRHIDLPDGSQRPFTTFKLTWRSYDSIVADGLYTGPELVGLAIAGCNESGRRFEDNFPNVLAYVHSRIRERNVHRIEDLHRRLQKAGASFRTAFRSASKR